jgi:hypothetical protein
MEYKNKILLLNLLLMVVLLAETMHAIHDFSNSYTNCGYIISASPGNGVVSLILLLPLLFFLVMNIRQSSNGHLKNRWYMKTLSQVSVVVVIIILIGLMNTSDQGASFCIP